MSLFQAVVLGIVQGLTEFLPVSSSGHLVLANYYFGWGHLPFYAEIATNTGTLLAVLVALRKDVRLAASGFAGLTSAGARQGEGWWLAILVILGSIPTAIIGLALKDFIEARLLAPFPVCIALIATGFILWFSPTSGKKTDTRELRKRDAVIGGITQGLAVIPGISRSGTTIATMMWRGAAAELAARFSFLMYLVVSVGVTLIGIVDIRESGIEAIPLIGMILASFLTGYAAILLLFSLLRRGQFKWFAPYLWVVAGITLARLFLT